MTQEQEKEDGLWLRLVIVRRTGDHDGKQMSVMLALRHRQTGGPSVSLTYSLISLTKLHDTRQ